MASNGCPPPAALINELPLARHHYDCAKEEKMFSKLKIVKKILNMTNPGQNIENQLCIISHDFGAQLL